MATLLQEKEISSLLKELRDWTRADKEIKKVCELKDFARAMSFVNSVALIAEKMNHHPDIDIRWNKVTLVLSTHSAGGLTSNDFNLAKAIDAL
ncbi:MAG: 4a-hydroxytetrahydrobiopterin dehydratase [Bacteroidota bacterium]